MIDLSVIICCYNGKERLRKTIEHLALQKTSLQWEFVLVDNASTDGSADYVESLWREYSPNVPLHIVNERQPGLVYARVAGVKAAKGKYVVFCDDDNWLREDYIQSAYELMEQMPNVGVLGGQSVLAPSIEAPAWWAEQQGNYAVGKQLPQSGVANDRGFLYGAGMVTRTDLARKIFDEHYPFLLTGRKGDQCLSGEDGEYCWRAMIAGYDLYYSENQFYYHDVAQNRLTDEQLRKLLQSFEIGKEIAEKYHYAIQYIKDSVIRRLAWLLIRIFNYLKASAKYKPRKRQLLHYHACICGIGKKDREFDVIRGYINYARPNKMNRWI